MTTMLTKLKAGIDRLDAYGAPGDNATLFVDDTHGCAFEILDSNDTVDSDAPCNSFTLGMLRLLITECEG